MAVSAEMPDREDLERAYRSMLKDEPLPGAVIDCASAEVLAANAGGLNILGLTPADRLPAALDSAMPAVSALRDLNRDGLREPVQRTLVFWRHGRTSTQFCELKAANSAAVSHVVVLFRPDADRVDAHSEDHAVSQAANDDVPARIVRDDSETLREIARRIREGQKPVGPLAAMATDNVENVEPSPWDVPRQSAPASPLSDVPPNTVPPIEILPPPDPVSALPPDDIAKLAHELKTPLTAIAAAAEIMRDQQLGAMGNDKYLGYAADIHDSATHALSVITNMLSAASNRLDNADAADGFDLTDLAEKTVSSLQPLAAQRDLALTLDGEANLVPVRANATAVRQILLNLLTNALKFTPPGGEVRVATGYLDDGAVFFTVRDTGDGITDAVLDRVFDDSLDTETYARRPGGGRGMGLRLVRRLAAETGALLDIDTMPGNGTVVMVAFPKESVGVRKSTPSRAD
jgi:two-component system, cell cycle sensor histidine kinase PleC